MQIPTIREMNLKPARTFTHNGREVEEYLIPEFSGTKLVWVLAGHLNKMKDDKGNDVPLFHMNYMGTNPGSADYARSLVQAEWDKHYR